MQRKDWISNLSAYWLVQWCTYPRIWKFGSPTSMGKWC